MLQNYFLAWGINIAVDMAKSLVRGQQGSWFCLEGCCGLLQPGS